MWQKARTRRKAVKRWTRIQALVYKFQLWPLLVVSGFCVLLALSNTVAIGPYIIFHYDLPILVERLVSPFRASGRFIWLPYYMLMAGILAILVKSFDDVSNN
jgi:hypothetical protein